MSATTSSSLDRIRVRGAREHNLRGIDVDIPRNQLVVITGLSGSGKSSLAFDTIYAEGQRRYVESLSAYARQFLEQMNKPDVESIDGLSPAISIEQKTTSKNPRSTVGTVTEIYDYLRLLYARAGTPYCPNCSKPIASQTVQEMTDRVLALGDDTKVQILAPVVRDRKGEYRKELDAFRKQGFVRARIDGKTIELDDTISLSKKHKHTIEIVIDRVVVKSSARTRIAESIETALKLSDGIVTIDIGPGRENWILSEKNACVDCGVSLPEIAPRLFSFNSPHGACPTCNGLGLRWEFDPAQIVPDPALSLSDGAIEPWGGKRLSHYYQQILCALRDEFSVDLEKPWSALPKSAKDRVLYGTGDDTLSCPSGTGTRARRVARKWDGVIGELERQLAGLSELQAESLRRYMSAQPCTACAGTRLRPEARSVKIAGLALHELSALSIAEAFKFLSTLSLGKTQREIADRILKEIRERLRFLLDVGLAYLTLNRSSATLSGGESQRIRLATQIGSSLMGVLYVLDEPSIGLHPRDHERLLASLVQLRDIGNSVLLVEHDETTIRLADYVIDMGPGAGIHGGEVVATGTPTEIMKNSKSLTGAYLAGKRTIAVPKQRRPIDKARMLTLTNCSEHNLKNVTLEIPLGLFTVVTGVSGSGKSTLINDTLHRALARKLHAAQGVPGNFDKILGLEHLDKVIDVSQAPIGRTPRSNPATYTGVFDAIRSLFAQVPEARMRGYQAGRFSFNVKGGRCEACQGDGMLRIEMHFLPDLFVPCEICSARRYNRETLEIKYKGKSIADVLEMSVEEALSFLENVPQIARPLQTLHDVGLDYIHLGQAATTLSGGEAQRIKLAKELSKRSTGRTLYLLDEPTTGLHFADVERLLDVLQKLVDLGNSVVVIEHHLDVIKAADHVIDLGPEGGDEGGEILVTGTPENVTKCRRSHTGKALASLLNKTPSAK